MMSCSKVADVALNNGRKMPALGLGLWRTPYELTCDVVKSAIDVGFRHFDCAYSYKNEESVGKAFEMQMTNGIVKREELFVTSKLWNAFHEPEIVREACQKSLKDLKLNYLDLYLIHWPMGYKKCYDELYPLDASGNIEFLDVDYVDTWRAMEKLVDEGLVRSIGLSNFNEKQIIRVLSVAKIKPAVLQVECHPYLNQTNLMEFCTKQTITFTAYSPLGSPHTPYEKPGNTPLLQNPVVCNIALLQNCSPAQVLLRYQIQRGNTVVTRSTNPIHMQDNLVIFEFSLTDMDMHALDNLDINGRFLKMESSATHPHYPFKTEPSC